MGYPTIDKFDLRFIERTKANLSRLKGANTFTHLINSLIGLVFIPNEFSKKGKKFKVDFLNSNVDQFKELQLIFDGVSNLSDEQGNNFVQRKFYYRNTHGVEQTINNTTVGDLVRLFRNSIAHQNITPVAHGDSWEGIIVKNYRTAHDEKAKNFNFEAFLTEQELKAFAIFIADEYMKNV